MENKVYVNSEAVVYNNNCSTNDNEPNKTFYPKKKKKRNVNSIKSNIKATGVE